MKVLYQDPLLCVIKKMEKKVSSATNLKILAFINVFLSETIQRTVDDPADQTFLFVYLNL